MFRNLVFDLPDGYMCVGRRTIEIINYDYDEYDDITFERGMIIFFDTERQLNEALKVMKNIVGEFTVENFIEHNPAKIMYALDNAGGRAYGTSAKLLTIAVLTHKEMIEAMKYALTGAQDEAERIFFNAHPLIAIEHIWPTQDELEEKFKPVCSEICEKRMYEKLKELGVTSLDECYSSPNIDFMDCRKIENEYIDCIRDCIDNKIAEYSKNARPAIGGGVAYEYGVKVTSNICEIYRRWGYLLPEWEHKELAEKCGKISRIAYLRSLKY
ncbi:MAG: hypothetical protein DRP08_01480 [Candidatus Aenigmatarchaeota archaeon]|nr:MAG: hypothetical protein DRP08_01480 [Candidatus Aenigmarchaeota archaeon]